MHIACYISLINSDSTGQVLSWHGSYKPTRTHLVGPVASCFHLGWSHFELQYTAGSIATEVKESYLGEFIYQYLLGRQLCQKQFCLPYQQGSVNIKVRICSRGSQFFSFKAEIFFKAFRVQESKQEVKKDNLFPFICQCLKINWHMRIPASVLTW